jgi:hypothetical protein
MKRATEREATVCLKEAVPSARRQRRNDGGARVGTGSSCPAADKTRPEPESVCEREQVFSYEESKGFPEKQEQRGHFASRGARHLFLDTNELIYGPSRPSTEDSYK